jgi:hypothetical protein
MTTGTIVGEGISGTTSEYPTSKFNGTGGAGKRTGIGRSSKPGASRVCNPGRDLNNRPGSCSNDRPGHREESSGRIGHHSAGRPDHKFERGLHHNAGREVSNPGRANHSARRNKRTTVREGKERNRIEGKPAQG